MKKLLAVTLAVLCVFMLCACGESDDPEPTEAVQTEEPTDTAEPIVSEEPEPSEDPDDPVDPNYTGLTENFAGGEVEDPSQEELDGDDDLDPEETADPEGTVKEKSREALEGELGIVLPAPEGATNLVWSRIEEASPIAQLTFTLDGKNYCFRAQETSELKDISDLSLSNPQTDSSNMDYTMKVEGGKGVVIWFVDGYSFCISMDSGASFDELELIYGTVNC